VSLRSKTFTFYWKYICNMFF